MKIEIIENDWPLTATAVSGVPELPKGEDLFKRVSQRKHLALVAMAQGKPVGFKLGYEVRPDTFYSWIGGVLPDYRNRGIAQLLLDYQEDWAGTHGYKRIDVKSMNKFPHMLHFLIKNRYQVYGIEAGERFEDSKILFFKKL